MVEELKNYIKQSLEAGYSQEEIKKSLIEAGWEKKNIDGAFDDVSKIAGYPDEIKVPFLKRNKKIIAIIGFGAVFVCTLIIVIWQIFQGTGIFQKRDIAANFSLEAKSSDSAGADPDTTFILKSSQSFSEKEIKNILKFDPEIKFNVRKVSQVSILISTVFAQEDRSNNLENTFEIKPDQPLEENKIYLATVDNSEYADREYSFAFQIKAPFQIIQTHPRNKATQVPKNSAIEITFNRENFINPENYFEINPKVDGRFEQRGDTLTFLPKDFSERTIYTIVIKKGLKIAGSEDALDEDKIFMFETGEQTYVSRPDFNFQGDFLEFIPGKNPVLEINYYNFDPKSLNINLYKFQDADKFIDSYQESRKWDMDWTNFYRRQNSDGFQPDERQKVLSFKPTIVISNYQKFIEIPEILESGYYLIDANFEGRHRQVWLQITPLAHYFSITHDKSLLWMYDFQKKNPISESKISFYRKTADENFLGATNSDGLLEFSTPDALKAENKDQFSSPQFFKVKQDGYPILFVKISDRWCGYCRSNIGEGDAFWDYLSADRFTYQMSDTVKYWGVIKGRQEDLRQKKIKIILSSGYWGGPYDGGGNIVSNQSLAVQEVLVSQFDTISGELSFKGVAPGFYQVMATIGDEVVSQANIEILSYTKPAYQITVTPSKSAIYAGDSVDFKVKANFFDETPVAGLKLNYQGYWEKDVSGELTLDENGEGSFVYSPHYYESKYAWWPRNFEISFSPKLSEEGEIWGTGRVLVFGPNIYLQSFQKKQEGENYKFTAKLNNIVIDNYGGGKSEYIGESAVNYPISARLLKITYTKVETGDYYDPIDKIARKTYRYDENTQVIETLSGLTDGKGEWSFVKNLPKEEGAIYRVLFSGQDSRGRKIESATYVYNFSYYGDQKKFAVSLDIENHFNGNQYSIGEKIKLELRILKGEKPQNSKVLFYRYQNNINKIFIKSDLSLEEDFQASFAPSVQYQAVILGPYGFEEAGSGIVSFKEEDNNLKININPEKEKYRPGDKIKLNLSVYDKNNKPVSAEVNVAAVDEALFHILPYNWQSEILPALFRDIYISPITGASQYNLLKGAGAEGGGCFGAGTPVLMADGSSKLIENIKVGDEILTFESENNYTRVSAVVQGISKHFVKEYLIINNSLEVTPNHRMYVNGKWDYAGNIKIGDILIGSDGSPRKIYSVIKKEIIDTPVYNIIVGKYHTYFADEYFAHNEEKGGGSPRVNFVDVAAYQTIHTDNNGKAEISFTAPDNITSWRITTIAFSADEMKAGQNVKLLPTSLLFFADAALSEYYLVGDNPIMRLRAFGTDYKQNQTTEFNVKSDSLNLNKKETSKENSVYVPLGRLSEGEHKIAISAKQDKLEDSLLRKINVVKNYFRKSESSVYELTENLSNIEGNSDGFTKLAFMDAGIGKFYQALWEHTYLSGIRLDQITAQYFGEKLLSLYFKEQAPTESLDLSHYQTDEGAMSLFLYSDSDIELSAKMADLAQDFVSQNKLKEYFNAALKDKKSDIHRIAKALYGLASLKEPVLTKTNLIKDRSELNLEDKIYIGLALAKSGDKEKARKVYERDIRSGVRFQGSEAWLDNEEDITKRVKLTGMIGVLASYLNIEKDTEAFWNYINSHDPARDLDVVEETLLMKSELTKEIKEDAKFSFMTNRRNDFIILEKGSAYILDVSFDEFKTIKFSNIEGKINLVSFYEKSQDPKELTKNNELNLIRKYFVDGRQTNSFKEGDVVLVRLDPNIAESAIDGPYQIIDYLPSGLRPITQLYEKGLSGGTECDPVWYPDKIINNIVYFDIYKGFDKTKNCLNRTLNYYARVVSGGNYGANPATIQSLKDLNSLNISAEDKVEIK